MRGCAFVTVEISSTEHIVSVAIASAFGISHVDVGGGTEWLPIIVEGLCARELAHSIGKGWPLGLAIAYT